MPPANAEVTKVDVISRTDIGAGYEQVVGRLHFAVDPKNPRNAVIADIDKAPKNAAGLVEFVADFSLQRPTSGGNGAALIDVVNRGGATALRLNRSTRPGDPADDGLLRKMGVAVMAVGWEFDVPARNGAIRIEVPVATENGAVITGIVAGDVHAEQQGRVVTRSAISLLCAGRRERGGYGAEGARPLVRSREADACRATNGSWPATS